jgi:hypothetical protein
MEEGEPIRTPATGLVRTVVGSRPNQPTHSGPIWEGGPADRAVMVRNIVGYLPNAQVVDETDCPF